MDAYVWVDAHTNPTVSRQWSDLETYYIDQGEDLERAYLRARESSRAMVLLCGDDRFVARVATYVLLRHDPSMSTGLNFAPLWTRGLGIAQTLARQSHIPRDDKRARRAFERLVSRQRLEPIRVPTLRLTSTLRASASLGFTAGFGESVAVAKAYAQQTEQSGLSALATMARDAASGPKHTEDSDTPQKVTFDAVAVALEPLTLVSATPQTWFGVPMGTSGLGVRQGESLAQLAKWAASAQVGLSRLRAGSQVSTVETIQWSGLQPYTLDGEVFEPAALETCQLSVGPTLRLVDWSASKR